MKILVTGGAGYIGSHTCVSLLASGYRIVVADDLRNSKYAAIERVWEITGKSFPFYRIDVSDEAALDAVVGQHQPDCAIHFAGLKAVGESTEKPLEYYTNNLNTTLTLCRVMGRHGVKRIIFSSSATVYHARKKMPLKETAPLGCLNPYGWTKLMCERILRDLSASDPQWSAVLLRYFNPIGAHESGLIGEDPEGIPNNLLPFITQTAMGRQKVLQIYGNDYATEDGTGVRDYIHVMDLAEGHVAALSYAIHHSGCEAFNLGTGAGYSVLEILDTFERVNSVRVPRKFAPRRPGDAAQIFADPNKARKMLGWQARKSLEEMCRDSWRWQQANPLGYPENPPDFSSAERVVQLLSPSYQSRS